MNNHLHWKFRLITRCTCGTRHNARLSRGSRLRDTAAPQPCSRILGNQPFSDCAKLHISGVGHRSPSPDWRGANRTNGFWYPNQRSPLCEIDVNMTVGFDPASVLRGVRVSRVRWCVGAEEGKLVIGGRSAREGGSPTHWGTQAAVPGDGEGETRTLKGAGAPTGFGSQYWREWLGILPRMCWARERVIG